MASAIGKLRQPRHERIVLIGHSGGGALAALLQSRVEGVIGVITVAANLDTDKWTAHHGYDGLTGSLNPMSQSTDARIPHLQLVGGKDDTVPRYTAEDYARRHPNVELIVIEDFDHACCWEEEWPGMLDRFSAMLDRK
jgi:pimeloyl-ACP methyl ester carboxylesterase